MTDVFVCRSNDKVKRTLKYHETTPVVYCAYKERA